MTAFGTRLRDAREARGVSLRQIADATKLPLRTLDALERGRNEFLPGGIYRRSLVRSYAREVGLDPEETLRDFLAEYPDDLPPPKTARAAASSASTQPATEASTEQPVPSWRGLAFRASTAAIPILSALARRALFDR